MSNQQNYRLRAPRSKTSPANYWIGLGKNAMPDTLLVFSLMISRESAWPTWIRGLRAAVVR